MTIRIMMVDDHRLLRETLAAPLAAEPDFDVVAQVGSAKEALDWLSQDCPDILLLDIGLPDMTGVDLARQALVLCPGLHIVVLSGYSEKMFVDELLGIGAHAYILKAEGVQELILGIRTVLSGEIYLSPEISAAMTEFPPAAISFDIPLHVLGRRELDVLRYVAKGLRSADIARKMTIQPATVDAHRANIKKKLGLHSTAQLTRYAIRKGLLSS